MRVGRIMANNEQSHLNAYGSGRRAAHWIGGERCGRERRGGFMGGSPVWPIVDLGESLELLYGLDCSNIYNYVTKNWTRTIIRWGGNTSSIIVGSSPPIRSSGGTSAIAVTGGMPFVGLSNRRFPPRRVVMYCRSWPRVRGASLIP